MKKKITVILVILSVSLSFYSCKTTCCHNITPVSFGVNISSIDTAVKAMVFVDNNEIGEIPGSVDSVSNCESEQTLNVEFGESVHLYKIVVFDSNQDTIAVMNGEFDVTKADCIKIFFDLTE